MNKAHALLFALMMMTVSLTGCFGGEDGDSNEENPIETLDDWQVYSVTSSSDLPECNDDTNGRLYYVEADGAFQVCKTSGWKVIEISGANGTNGLKALISSTSEPSGNNCANGGIQIEIGVDDNNNEVLEASEIDQTQYICNGNSSSHTMPVSSSNNTMLTSVTPPGSNLSCDAGGRVISHGLDNGDGGGVYANGILETGEVDASTTLCSRTGIGLLKDTNNGFDSGSPRLFTAVGNTLYFTASDGTNGAELWKSDGTANGTMMIKDINSDDSGSGVSKLTAVGNTLYFSASDGSSDTDNGVELWKSDGTASGTVMVKDINSGSGYSYPSGLTAVGNTLYFRAYDGDNGVDLWKSDGTASGTVMVKDINSPLQPNIPSDPSAVVGNTFYFLADDGTNGKELWKSDGTANGTVMVKDINSGSSSGSPSHLTAFGNTLYFTANDGTNGYELWKSDGTASGTVMVKDINSGSSSSDLGDLTAIGNTLYFRGTDGTNGNELWKSDGTASGTVMVKNIKSGSGSGYPNQLTAVGTTLYFTAEGYGGVELWMSDGTEAGTVMVEDIRSGSGSSYPSSLTAIGNTLYFAAEDVTNGRELWKSDGTEAGTVVVEDISSGSSSSDPDYLAAIGNTLYFSAYGDYGQELYFDGLVTTEITYS